MLLKTFGYIILFISPFLFVQNKVIINDPFEYNSISIELIDARVVYENGIGDDWFFYTLVDDVEIYKGKKRDIDLRENTSISIKSIAIEDDPNHDDIGTELFVIHSNNINRFVENSSLKQRVEVYEKYGKGAGNTAICEFQYRIIPK